MTIPSEIEKLTKRRLDLKLQKKYQESDKLRQIIEKKGYSVMDTRKGQIIKQKTTPKKPIQKNKKSLIAVFGSGEMSPTGRRVHEYLIKDLNPPVKIALLETPTGFEENPHHWYEKLEEMLIKGLRNFKPQISKVAALRNDGPNSTNDPRILESLLEADYIHTGAGSPSYAARHLENSLAFKYLISFIEKNKPLSFASATAVAFSKYLLPVYEIYKVGEDLHWKQGLDFFEKWRLNLTIIPHWNNTEGGKEVDTSRCYMGKKRFAELLEILPGPTTILGIDEQTACIFDLDKKVVTLMGIGGAIIQKGFKTKIIKPNSTFNFQLLNSSW